MPCLVHSCISGPQQIRTGTKQPDSKAKQCQKATAYSRQTSWGTSKISPDLWMSKQTVKTHVYTDLIKWCDLLSFLHFLWDELVNTPASSSIASLLYHCANCFFSHQLPTTATTQHCSTTVWEALHRHPTSQMETQTMPSQKNVREMPYLLFADFSIGALEQWVEQEKLQLHGITEKPTAHTHTTCCTHLSAQIFHENSFIWPHNIFNVSKNMWPFRRQSELRRYLGTDWDELWFLFSVLYWEGKTNGFLC